MPKEIMYGETISANLGPDGGEIRIQLGLKVGWTKGGNALDVQVVGRDPESGAELGIPGFAVTLDWMAANRAVGAFRDGRDQTFGKPE